MPSHSIQATKIGLLVVLSVACQVHAEQPPAEAVTVSKTYDGNPFVYRSQLLAERAQFRVYRLTYPSPMVTPVMQNNTVPADFYLPKHIPADGRQYPAVICLHILDGNEPLTELVCSVLANRGVPALSFKLPYYGSRGGPQGPRALADDPKMFVGAIVQAGEDIRRTIDLLASRPEIDPERIGIAGISLGGIIAATAAGAEPRLHRAGLILAGGDILQIIHHAQETRPLSQMIGRLPPTERADLEAKLEAVDPLRFAPGLGDRARSGKVLMINAAEDEVIPRRCTEKLARALGIADRVVWLEGLGHYTVLAELPRALRMTADFFAQDLPEQARPTLPTAVAAEPTPCSGWWLSLNKPSAWRRPSRGQAIAISSIWSCRRSTRRAGRSPAASAWSAAHTGRFALRCRLPEIGQLSLGQGRLPWMVAGGKTLLAGTKNPVENANALSHVEPRHLQKLHVLAGLGGSIALAPEMLQQWITVEDDNAATGGRAIRIAAKDSKKVPGAVRIAFQDDGRTPAAVAFTVAGYRGKLHVHGWQSDTIAPEALFEPPAGLPRSEVEQSDLCRMFAAALNFAAERFEPGRDPHDAGKPEVIKLLARDPAGHGMLCRCQGKTILMVSGTPAQMGTAQGDLLRPMAQKLAERVVYLAGGGDTLYSGEWFIDRMAEIQRRTTPHIPPRFLEECDALARAAGVSERDGRYANLFPERFHCSGVALRGKATAGGRVLHARVLDYMREIDLQSAAVVAGVHARRPLPLDEPRLRRLHRHGDGDERAGAGRSARWADAAKVNGTACP